MDFGFINGNKFNNNSPVQPHEIVEQPYPNSSMNIWDDKSYLDFVRHYSEDEVIPQEVKTTKWAVFGRTMVYTFMNETDMPMVDIFSNILKIDTLMARPPHLINYNDIDQLDQTQLYFWLSAKRAIGTDKDKMNERTLQQTQIAQSINMQQMSQQKAAGSAWQRLKKLF